MQMQVYHLRARSAFHLGERGIGVEHTDIFARADTVFSALCTMIRQWAGEAVLVDFLAAMRDQPPLLLSSAFPYVDTNDGAVRLYPRPLGGMPGTAPDDLAAFKAVKHVAFVSEAVFIRWVSGQPFDYTLMQDESIAVTAEEESALGKSSLFWQVDEVPRVTIDRVTNASAVFQAGRVKYAPDGGLWLGIQWLDESWRPTVETALTLLGDAGLGGERSVGHGQFELLDGSNVDLPDPAGRFVTLSPIWPQNQQQGNALLADDAIYQFVVRRGWIGSPEGSGLRRRAVRMLAEGSVLTGDSLAGGLVDVSPEIFSEHPVYRYGYGLPVGMSGG